MEMELGSINNSLTFIKGSLTPLVHVSNIYENVRKLRVELANKFADIHRIIEINNATRADVAKMIKSLEEYRVENKKNIADGKKEMASLADASKSIANQIVKLSESTDVADKEIQKIIGELKDALLEKLNLSLESMKKTIDELSSSIETHDTEIQKTIGELKNALLEKLNLSLESMKKTIEELSSSIETRDKENRERTAEDVKKLVESIAALTTLINTNHGAMGKRVDGIKTSVNEKIGKDVKTIVDAIATLTSLINTNQTAMNAQVDTVKTSVAETINKDVKKLVDDSIAALTTTVNANNTSMGTQLEAVKTSVTEKINSMDFAKKYEQLMEKLISIASVFNELKSLLEKVVLQHGTNESKIKVLSEKVSNLIQQHNKVINANGSSGGGGGGGSSGGTSVAATDEIIDEIIATGKSIDDGPVKDTSIVGNKGRSINDDGDDDEEEGKDKPIVTTGDKEDKLIVTENGKSIDEGEKDKLIATETEDNVIIAAEKEDKPIVTTAETTGDKPSVTAEKKDTEKSF